MSEEEIIMIFVTVGSQKFQFNRLLKAIDDLVGSGTLTEEVFAQTGYSTYKPVHYAYSDFMDRNAFRKEEGRADLVITHGGSGAVIGALKQGKRVIAVPRLAAYGEHVDDHQKQLASQFSRSHLILVCEDTDKLAACIERARTEDFARYESHTQDFIEDIDGYLQSLL